MNTLQITVLGEPTPQAAGTTIVRGKSRFRAGTSRSLAFWRDRVATEAQAAVAAQGWTLADGPLQLSCEFVMPRPQSHPKTKWRPCTKRPDLKNLVWACEDALAGIAFADDRQITTYGRVHKRYAEPGEQSGAIIKLAELVRTARRE
jgi:Holliday junction resolvase RusA-like endonuclease